MLHTHIHTRNQTSAQSNSSLLSFLINTRNTFLKVSYQLLCELLSLLVFQSALSSRGLKAGFVSGTSWEHHVPPSNIISFSELQKRLMESGPGDTHLVHLCSCMSATLESWNKEWQLSKQHLFLVRRGNYSGGFYSEGMSEQKKKMISIQKCQILTEDLSSLLKAPS